MTSTILTGLDAGTEYNIRVRAVSAAGAGEWSVEQTNTTLDSERIHALSAAISCICILHILYTVALYNNCLVQFMSTCYAVALCISALCRVLVYTFLSGTYCRYFPQLWLREIEPIYCMVIAQPQEIMYFDKVRYMAYQPPSEF